MFKKSSLRNAAALALMLAAGAVQAHPGHGDAGFSSGLAHPFMGLDHLLAMVAVGAWSCLALPASKRIAGPLVFMVMLAVGALLAPMVGIGASGVEMGVAFSVTLLGGLLLAGRRLGGAAGLSVVGAAAFLHGVAHGSELFTGGPAVGTLLGMLLGSALLHGVGYVAGVQMFSAPRWVHRFVAAGLGISGLAMLATRL